MAAGRYAPSPSGDLHLGNLRTAILAWLCARSSGRELLLRYEDLDAGRTVPGSAQRQLEDMHAIGLSFDGEPVHQSQRLGLYRDAVADLRARGLLYECFCTRRDIQDAPRAPHTPPGAYPGTCRHLTEPERTRRRAERPAAWRLRTEPREVAVRDSVLGRVTAVLDDVVVVRNDGAPAYNLAVVVDDHLTGVDQVVRGDDLASSAPRQAHLRALLYGDRAYDEVDYVHVPLMLNDRGERLAKRDGAVTLEQLARQGLDSVQVRDALLDSLGLPPGPLDAALEAFSATPSPMRHISHHVRLPGPPESARLANRPDIEIS